MAMAVRFPYGSTRGAEQVSEASQNRLIDVVLDDESIGRATPDVEHERAVAIFDLLEENSFLPTGDKGGPYKLTISLVESRTVTSKPRTLRRNHQRAGSAAVTRNRSSSRRETVPSSSSLPSSSHQQQ